MGNNYRSIETSQVRPYNLDIAAEHRTLFSINILVQDNDSFTAFQNNA